MNFNIMLNIDKSIYRNFISLEWVDFICDGRIMLVVFLWGDVYFLNFDLGRILNFIFNIVYFYVDYFLVKSSF